MSRQERPPSRTEMVAIWALGILVGLGVGVVTSDVILGVIGGAAFIAIFVGLVRLWSGDGTPRTRHP